MTDFVMQSQNRPSFGKVQDNVPPGKKKAQNMEQHWQTHKKLKTS
jgi:hypothetical protein